MDKKTKALSSVLRLLVYLRAVLKIEGAATTPLFNTVDLHMQLVGQALPTKHLLTAEERKKIETAAGMVVPVDASKPKLPAPGGMMVLGPQHFLPDPVPPPGSAISPQGKKI